MTNQRSGSGNIWLRDWTTDAVARIGRWQSAAVSPALARARRGIATIQPSLRLLGPAAAPGRLLARSIPRGLPLVLRARRSRRDLGRPMITAQSALSVQTATTLQRVPEPSDDAPLPAAVYETPAPSPPPMPRSVERRPESVVSRAARGVLRLLRREPPRGSRIEAPASEPSPPRTVSRSTTPPPSAERPAPSPAVAPDVSRSPAPVVAPATPGAQSSPPVTTRELVEAEAGPAVVAPTALPSSGQPAPSVEPVPPYPRDAGAEIAEPRSGDGIARLQTSPAPGRAAQTRPRDGLLLSLRRRFRRDETPARPAAFERQPAGAAGAPAIEPALVQPTVAQPTPAPLRQPTPGASSPESRPARRGLLSRAVAAVRRPVSRQAPTMELRLAARVQRAASTPETPDDARPAAGPRPLPGSPTPSLQAPATALAPSADHGATPLRDADIPEPMALRAAMPDIESNEQPSPLLRRPTLLAAPALIYRTIARLRPRPRVAAPPTPAVTREEPAPPSRHAAAARAGALPARARPATPTAPALVARRAYNASAPGLESSGAAASALPSHEPADLQLLRRQTPAPDGQPTEAAGGALTPSHDAPTATRSATLPARPASPLRAFRRLAPPARRAAPSLVYRASRPLATSTAPGAWRAGSTPGTAPSSRNGHAPLSLLGAASFGDLTGDLPADQAAMVGRSIAVQRAVTFEDATPEAAPAPEAAPGGEGGAPGGAPLEKLAQQVYEQLRRRLLVEHERAGLSRVAW